MRRLVTLAFMMTMVVVMAHAQGALKKVYNESIDPMSQIDAGLQKARPRVSLSSVSWVATGVHGVFDSPISLRRIWR